MAKSDIEHPEPRRVTPVATLSGADTRSLLAALSRLGLQRERLLTGVGLDASGDFEPEARVPQSLVASMIRAAERLTDDPAIALRITENITVGVSGSVLSRLVMASGSGLSALRHVARYGAVTAEGVRMDVLEKESTVLFVFELEAGAAERVRHLTEILLSSIRLVFDAGLAQPVAPLQVAFRHSAPADVEPFEEFFGCPVEFGARACAMQFPRDPLLQPMLGADPRLEARLVELAESELRRIAPEVTVAAAEEVRIAIEKLERPVQAAIAKRLGMGDRTLQRRLQNEGTSFRAVVDEVRRSLASSMLQRSGNRVLEVALAVGFDDATSFARAFRRWTGESPTEYQARFAHRDDT